MSKHTPGPWMFGIRNYEDCTSKPFEKPFDYVGPGYYENPGIFAADGTEIVGCDEYSIFNSPEDARLLCAAPDLLDALKGLVDLAHEAGFPCDKAEAAIAKATGEVNV